MNESEKRLHLLREYVIVSVQEYDDEGRKVGEPTNKKFASPEEAEEITWRLDKYGRPDWKSTRKYLETGPVYTDSNKPHASRDPFGRLESSERESAMNSIDSLVDELVALNNEYGTTRFNRRQLIDLILPWDEVGFDALRRIYITSKRMKSAFPFFLYRRRLNPITSVKTLPFPTVPNSALIEWLLEQKPRVGSSEVGKGEFLLSILTGAKPKVKHPGDLISLGGTIWEVKDMRKAKLARLGDVDSDAFNEMFKSLPRQGYSDQEFSDMILQGIFTNWSVKPKPTDTKDPPVDQDTTPEVEKSEFDRLTSQQDEDEFDVEAGTFGPERPAGISSKKNPVQDEEVPEADGGETLTGFVAVTNDGFKLVPIPNVKFGNRNKRKRVHVWFEGI